MGYVSTAAHLGGSQVFGIIPTALAEGNFVGKTVVLVLRRKFFKSPFGLNRNIHHKPINLLNVDGFFNKLLSFLDQAGEENFIPLSARQIFIYASTTEEMIEKLEDFV
ncbi:hypothetical protein DITRI_Ditri04bG0060600 [Diplodiscus trichospermus]